MLIVNIIFAICIVAVLELGTFGAIDLAAHLIERLRRR